MNGFTNKLILTLFCAAMLALAISCGEKKPEGVLSRAEMVQILEEMYLAEEKANRLALPRDSAKKVFKVMEEKVFNNFAANDSIFQRSFDYYMEHPSELELIYTALVDTLQLREQRAPFHLEQR